MKKAPSSKTSIRKLLPQLDPTDMLIPLFVVVALCVIFIFSPEESTRVVDAIRGFLGNQLSAFYILIGVGFLVVSL